MNLLIGVKRKVFRKDDPRSEQADRELHAKRDGVLRSHHYTCAGCGYAVPKGDRGEVSPDHARHLDVHHLDDDHQNNAESNLVPACHACHPYQHIGQHGASDAHMAVRSGPTLLATMPEVSARDLNLLLRALGAALNDPQEQAIANGILDALCERADITFDEFLDTSPDEPTKKNFLMTLGAALSKLSESEYAGRDAVLGDQRLVFNPTHLRLLGAEFSADYPTVPLSSWEQVSRSALRHGSQEHV
jgi:hypothetical protein